MNRTGKAIAVIAVGLGVYWLTTQNQTASSTDLGSGSNVIGTDPNYTAVSQPPVNYAFNFPGPAPNPSDPFGGSTKKQATTSGDQSPQIQTTNAPSASDQLYSASNAQLNKQFGTAQTSFISKNLPGLLPSFENTKKAAATPATYTDIKSVGGFSSASGQNQLITPGGTVKMSLPASPASATVINAASSIWNPILHIGQKKKVTP